MGEGDHRLTPPADDGLPCANVRNGRRIEKVWAADEDPLAWWTLVELLVSAIKAAGGKII